MKLPVFLMEPESITIRYTIQKLNVLFSSGLKYFIDLFPDNLIILKFKQSNIFRRIAIGSFWNALLNLYGKGVSFIGTIIIIRILGRESFGEFGMLSTTISTFGMFTTFSLSQTATKYIAQYRGNDKEKVGRITGLSLLFSLFMGIMAFLLVTIFAETIAVRSLNAPSFEGYLKFMAIGLLFGAINGAQNGILTGFEAFKTNAILGVILSTVLIIGKVILTKLYDFHGAVIGLTLEPILVFLMTLFITRRVLKHAQIQIRFKAALLESKVFFNYSIPSMLTGFIVFPTNWYTMTLLAKSTGGYREVGAYNAANQWYSVLIFIPYIIVSTFLPVFSEMLSRGERKNVLRIINNTILLVVIIFVLLTLLFLVFGEKIASIYGKEFYGTGFLLALAVCTLIPQSLNIVLGNLIAALDKMWFGLYVNVIWCISFVGLTYLLITSGALGLLISRFISYLISFMLMLFFYIKFINKDYEN